MVKKTGHDILAHSRSSASGGQAARHFVEIIEFLKCDKIKPLKYHVLSLFDAGDYRRLKGIS